MSSQYLKYLFVHLLEQTCRRIKRDEDKPVYCFEKLALKHFVMSVIVQVQVTFTQSREFTFLALRHCSIHLVLNFPQMASQLSWSLHCSTTNVALIVLEAEVFGESSLAV